MSKGIVDKMRKTIYNPTREQFLACKRELPSSRICQCSILRQGKFIGPKYIFDIRHGDIFKYYMYNGSDWVINPMALPFVATSDPYINAYGKPVVECRQAPIDMYKSQLKKEK